MCLHDGPGAPAADLDPKGFGLNADVIEAALNGARGCAGEVEWHRHLIAFIGVVINLGRGNGFVLITLNAKGKEKNIYIKEQLVFVGIWGENSENCSMASCRLIEVDLWTGRFQVRLSCSKSCQ